MMSINPLQFVLQELNFFNIIARFQGVMPTEGAGTTPRRQRWAIN
jgi:hypothetical protein